MADRTFVLFAGDAGWRLGVGAGAVLNTVRTPAPGMLVETELPSAITWLPALTSVAVAVG